MQVQATQHRFGPLGIPASVSFLAVNANLFQNKIIRIRILCHQHFYFYFYEGPHFRNPLII